MIDHRFPAGRALALIRIGADHVDGDDDGKGDEGVGGAEWMRCRINFFLSDKKSVSLSREK